ncbi:MAG: hypothetical protein ACRDKT_11190 [Actinomycetota bacterium]
MDPLWARSPLVLLRFPTLAIAIAAGALILALAAVSYPLFLSAARNELVTATLSKSTVSRYGAGITYRSTNVRFGERVQETREVIYEARDELFPKVIGSIPQLDAPLQSTFGPQIRLWPAGVNDVERERDTRLFSRDHQLDHVEVIEGRDGSGVWIADYTADAIGVSAGDEITMSFQGGPEATVPVDGIYRAIFNEPETGYWRLWRGEIYPNCSGGLAGCTPPPPFVLADHDQVVALTRQLGDDTATFAWDAPLAPGRGRTLEDLRDLERSHLDLVDRMQAQGTRLNDVFQCCGPISGFFFQQRAAMSSSVPQVLAQVEQRIPSAEVPVRLSAIAALIIAIAVVAGAGGYTSAARRVERQLQFARGVGATSVGARAAIEAVVPCILGGLVGGLLAWFLIATIGPDGLISSEAGRTAIVVGAASVVVAALVVGVVNALTFARGDGEGISSRSWSAIRFISPAHPWELGLLALAGYLYVQLQRRGVLVGTGAVDRPNFLLFLFPIMFISGFGVLAARSFRALFKVIRRRDERLSSPLYLVVNRVAGAPALVLLLFAAGAAALGVYVHARTVVASLERTVDAKSRLFVGSDVAALVGSSLDPPAGFEYPITKVFRIAHAGRPVGIPPTPGPEIDVIAVDPGTLSETAHWDPAFGTPTLDAAIAGLSDGRGDTLPAVLAGADLGRVVSFDIAGDPFGFEVIRELEAFPGMVSERPLLVVNRTALEGLLERRSSGLLNTARVEAEWWVRGEATAVEAALARTPAPPVNVLTAAEVRDIPSISSVIDTFRVLDLLGSGAALLVIVAMLMYLQARKRSRVVSYALARRMGLAHRSHGIALAIELGAMLLASYVVALVVATGASWLIASMVDPLPTIPPETLFTVPVGWLVLSGAALGVIAVVAGVATNATGGRTDLGSLMRVAE